MEFLPEFKVVPLNGGYAPVFRLFELGEWRYVCDAKTKKKRIMQTSSQALQVAREHVKKILNPEIRTIDAGRSGDDEEAMKDILGVSSWRAKKHQAKAEAQIVRNRKTKKAVVVERRGANRKRDDRQKKS